VILISLGLNPDILIIIIFLELLLIIVPAFITYIITKKKFLEEIKDMGFKKDEDFSWKLFFEKVIFGIILGIILFIISGYLIYIFKNIIVESIFGNEFVLIGENNAINTTPINPNIIQLIIIIILQVIILSPCEEGFFRGFIIKKCEIKIKRSYALLISSISFTFYHVPPFLVPISTIITYFGYYCMIGIILSLVYIYTNYSLVVCCVAHSFFNILIILI